MHKKCTNIYKEARENAKMTRLQASLLLSISESTLKTYETGITIPNDDVVLEMTKIYKDKKVGYIHLRRKSALAEAILEELVEGDLSNCMLKLLKEFNDFVTVKEKMIAIACDGKVGFEEKEVWNKSMKELKDVSAVVKTLALIT